MQCEATRLFVERATFKEPEFALTRSHPAEREPGLQCFSSVGHRSHPAFGSCSVAAAEAFLAGQVQRAGEPPE